MQNDQSAAPPAKQSFISMHTELGVAKSEAPLGFLKWSGISTLAATCGRQVYTRLLGPQGSVLYPNMYILLIGDAGLGKTVSIRSATDQMAAMRIRFAPAAITSSKFVTWASQASMQALDDGSDPGVMAALSNLDSLFNKRSPQELKSFLVAAYDCDDNFIKDTQQRGTESIHKMCMNLLAGGTPAHLASCFQPTDWGEGLASRFVIVAEKDDRIEDLPAWPTALSSEYATRLKDLRSDLRGKPQEITWTPEAWKARENWRKSNRHTQPPHPHAAGYWSRRNLTLAKMSMLQAVSNGSTVISTAEWDAALYELGVTELGLPLAFFFTSGNPYVATTARIVEWVRQQGRAVQEHEVRMRLQQFVTPQHLQPLLDSILASHQLIGVGTSPTREISHPDFQSTQKAKTGVGSWSQLQAVPASKSSP